MVDAYAEERSSEIGEVGSDCRIVGARFIREVRIGNGVEIDGASILENATLCDGARVGVDVKAYDLIAAEGSVIDNGSIVERCFVGESCRLDKGFTAAESLFFANSHCENGEAASIFAGPYTVSHHKSSLLIAGMFSFFNAGSGAEPEQPPLQERRRAPVGAPARLQVRQQRLHHVARARGRLHDGHGTPLLPPRHLGLPLLLSDREGRAHAPHAGRQPHQLSAPCATS